MNAKELDESWLSANCDVQEGGIYVFSVTSNCKWPTMLKIMRCPAESWLAMLEQVPAIDDPPGTECVMAINHPRTRNDVMRLVEALRGSNDHEWRMPDERL